MDNNELLHYGVKGMKWGVLRYQNRDGSLTPAGKKRYKKEMDKLKKKERTIKNKQRTKAMLDKLEAKEREVEALKRGVKSNETPIVKKKTIKELSDAELKNMLTRLDNEAKLKQHLEKDRPVTKKIAKTMIEDMVAPAAMDLGKQVAKSFMTKGVNKVFEKMGLEEEYKAYTNNKKKN